MNIRYRQLICQLFYPACESWTQEIARWPVVSDDPSHQKRLPEELENVKPGVLPMSRSLECIAEICPWPDGGVGDLQASTANGRKHC